MPINSRTDWNARRKTIALTSWKFLECNVHVQRTVSHYIVLQPLIHHQLYCYYLLITIRGHSANLYIICLNFVRVCLSRIGCAPNARNRRRRWHVRQTRSGRESPIRRKTGRTHTCRRSSDCFGVLVLDAAAVIQRQPKSSIKTDAACVCAFSLFLQTCG